MRGQLLRDERRLHGYAPGAELFLCGVFENGLPHCLQQYVTFIAI